ncbi:MAG: protein translocase subunit SecF [Actinomycetota bacterium]
MNLQHAVDAYRGHTIPRFRLIEHRNWWFGLSGAVIVLSLIGLVFGHLNLSIDFEGGAQLQYSFTKAVTVREVTDVLNANGHGDSEVQIANGDTVLVRTSTLTADRAQSDALLKALADQAGIDVGDINQQDVGPTWGKEISKKALTGLFVVLAAIMLYISLRFAWKMAIGAIVALLHDVIITAGIYALVGRQVTPATVIAILTILGFSLYDTVVIYDKIKENTETSAMVSRLGYAETVNYSLNQVFMRSVNTSLVVLLPILSLLLIGGDTLKDFAFAMFVGVATGAYSSIFIAAPLLTILKGREEKYRQLDARRQVRVARERVPVAGGARVAVPEVAGDGEVAAVPTAVVSAAATRATARSGGPARPRPKSKRKPPAKKRRR